MVTYSTWFTSPQTQLILLSLAGGARATLLPTGQPFPRLEAQRHGGGEQHVAHSPRIGLPG